MIVVDAHIIAALLLRSEKTSIARQLLIHDTVWIAPLIWRSEFRQILSYYIRKQILSLHQANMVMQEAENLMQGGQFDVPSLEIFVLAEEYDCPAYTVEYAALAQELGVPWVTTDRSSLRKFPQIAVSAEEFVTSDVTQKRVLAETL